MTSWDAAGSKSNALLRSGRSGGARPAEFSGIIDPESCKKGMGPWTYVPLRFDLVDETYYKFGKAKAQQKGDDARRKAEEQAEEARAGKKKADIRPPSSGTRGVKDEFGGKWNKWSQDFGGQAPEPVVASGSGLAWAGGKQKKVRSKGERTAAMLPSLAGVAREGYGGYSQIGRSRPGRGGLVKSDLGQEGSQPGELAVGDKVKVLVSLEDIATGRDPRATFASVAAIGENPAFPDHVKVRYHSGKTYHFECHQLQLVEKGSRETAAKAAKMTNREYAWQTSNSQVARKSGTALFDARLSAEVRAFIQSNGLDDVSERALFKLSPDECRAVMAPGKVTGPKIMNPAAVLHARIIKLCRQTRGDGDTASASGRAGGMSNRLDLWGDGGVSGLKAPKKEKKEKKRKRGADEPAEA